MSNDSYDRTTIDTASPGRLRRMFDTLQDTLIQPVETVTRRATLQSTGGDVEDIDPPEDIDELVELSKDVGLIQKNIAEFVSDVTEPGVTVESPDDATQDYFMGGDAAPESAPANGFLSECWVFDEKQQPMQKGLEITVREKWRRGTILIEYLRNDPSDPESIITGFTHIRPETVSARTYENTNQLVVPELDADENSEIEIPRDEVTKRDEAASYVQFDENSILGRRDNRFESKTSIPLSQNDVLKQTREQDIGGEDPEDGVFGESVVRHVRSDAEGYRQMKNDFPVAAKSKAWGLWTAQFKPEVIETATGTEIIEWSDEGITQAEADVENMGPGSVLTSDAKIDLQRHDGDVPNLEWALRLYARDIIDPLPAPFYKHAQADEINQFVTDEQQEDYQKLILSERHAQEEQWQIAFRKIAEKHSELDPTGLDVKIQPAEDDSPVMTLDTETVERIETFASALSDLTGASDPVAVFGEETIRSLVAQLPEDEAMQETLGSGLDEDDKNVQEQFDSLRND